MTLTKGPAQKVLGMLLGIALSYTWRGSFRLGTIAIIAAIANSNGAVCSTAECYEGFPLNHQRWPSILPINWELLLRYVH